MSVVERKFTTTLSPYDITALRFACAGLLLAPVVYRRGWGIRQVGVTKWLVIVCCAGVPYVLIASSGLQFAPAAHAGALVPGTMPLWAALLAMLFLRENSTICIINFDFARLMNAINFRERC